VADKTRADHSHFPVENKEGRSEKEGFRGLWRRLKPADKPDEVQYFRIAQGVFIYNFIIGSTV
jgi:hypothetical protein